MSFDSPTTKERKETFLANLEASLGQTSPLNKKAFLRVLAAIEALSATSLDKFASERAKQNFVISATGDDLDRLGAEYGVTRKAAEATVLTIELPATDGTLIPATVDFIGDANGVRYFPDSSAVAAGGVAVLTVTAEVTGVVGNLQVSDTLTIGTQIAGAETVASVTSVDNLGAEGELDEPYRFRILDKIRARGGGGNAADYREWTEEVAGVARGYPYSGRPISDPLPTQPPDRTVYVQADSTIDPDGLAPQSLLDEVRENITTDPVTGLARQPLGLTDETLFIESITLTAFYIRITNLTVSSEVEAAAKADIETALQNYFLSIRPFIGGIDSALERNDLITDLTISDVIQDVLSSYGGSASGASFGLNPGDVLSEYRMNQGELAKLAPGGITYV